MLLQSPHPGIEFKIGQPFFINSRQGEEASIASALQREDVWSYKARDGTMLQAAPAFANQGVCLVVQCLRGS